MRKNQGMSHERSPVFVHVQDLHAVSLHQKSYNMTVPIVSNWADAFRWLPEFVRAYFIRPRPVIGMYSARELDKNKDSSQKSLILLVADDSTGDEAIGAIALYREKTDEYVMFDFERGHAEDFHALKRLVEENWQAARQMYSEADWQALLKADHHHQS